MYKCKTKIITVKNTTLVFNIYKKNKKCKKLHKHKKKY